MPPSRFYTLDHAIGFRVRSLPHSPTPSIGFTAMELPADFHDWEILLGSDAVDEPKPLQASSDVDSEDGVIKFDYFALDSNKFHREVVEFDVNTHGEEGQVDSDNPSWVDPDSASQFVGRAKREVVFAGIDFPRKDFSGFWSDESSEAHRSLYGSEKGTIDVDELDKKDVGVERIGVRQGRGVDDEKSDEENSDEHVNMNISSAEKGSASGEMRGTVWWKFPFEILKLCLSRVKPVWSISFAAAIIGVLILGKRLFGMKHKTRSIPLKLILDEKRASQLKIHAARLNEAFSVVKRSPIIRPSLPAGGLTPWSVVSLQ